MTPQTLRFSVLLLLAGCAPVEPSDEDSPLPPGLAITFDGADPTVGDFGSDEVGEPDTITATLVNPGGSPLTIYGASHAHPDLVVEGLQPDVALPAGTSRTVEITWPRLVDEDLDLDLEIDSNAPDAPLLAPLSGQAFGPGLELPLGPLSFGDRYIGCQIVRSVEVTNRGRRALIIDDWELTSDSSPDFSTLTAGPWELAPGESGARALLFEPSDVGSDTATLRVVSNDPTQPEVAVQLEGAGHLPTTLEEVVALDADLPFDVLLVVERLSTSEWALLPSRARTLVDHMDALGVDARFGVIGVAGPLAGQLQGPTAWVNLDDPDPAGAFEANVAALDPEFGAAAFDAALAALRPPLTDPGGPNEDFRRPGAGLSLLFVSDQQEQSSGSIPAYVDAFLAESQGALLLQNLTGGLTGCSGAGGSASAGTDYVAASTIAGGLSVSFCDPGDVFEHFAAPHLAPQRSITLQQPANPATLVIERLADGGSTWELVEGWTWKEGNRVLLPAETPVGPNQLVRLTYDVAEPCP